MLALCAFPADADGFDGEGTADVFVWAALEFGWLVGGPIGGLVVLAVGVVGVAGDAAGSLVNDQWQILNIWSNDSTCKPNTPSVSPTPSQSYALAQPYLHTLE